MGDEGGMRDVDPGGGFFIWFYHDSSWVSYGFTMVLYGFTTVL